MDEIARLLQELEELRGESARIRANAPSPQGQMGEIADRAWRRADELTDGLLRVAASPELSTCCGAFARILWEDMITLEYVKKAPDKRIPQLLASALDHHKKVASSQWGREGNIKGLGPEEAAFLKKRRKEEKTVQKQLKTTGLQNVPVDQHALLPSVSRRATDVGSHDQYEVPYAMESAGAVHFGLAALYDPPGGGIKDRLLRALTLGTLSYRVLLAIVMQCLGLQTECEALLAPLKRSAP